MNRPTVTITFVLYRDYGSLVSLLNSQHSWPDSLYLYIVDNTEEHLRDKTLRNRLREIPNLTVVPNSSNLGYSGGAQHVLDNYEAARTSDYYCLANTDLSLDLNQTYDALARRSPEPFDVGAIAPRLESTQLYGWEQHYRQRPDARKMRRLGLLYRFYPMALLHRLGADFKRWVNIRFIGKLARNSAPEIVFAPHGALIIVTSEYLRRTLQFTFPAFLFCEEMFLGLQCETYGLRCVYDPAISFSHKNHGSMGRIPSRQVVGFLHEAHTALADQLKSDVI